MLKLCNREFIVNFFVVIILVVVPNQMEVESSSVSCGEVKSKSFDPKAAYVRENKDLTSSVSYKGTYKECILDGNGSLQIELERVFNVSDIGLPTKLFNSLEVPDISVSVFNNLTSNQTKSATCSNQGAQDNWIYFRCNSNGGYGGFMSSTVEISRLNSSSSSVSLNLFPNETWMYVIYKPYENHEHYEKQCRSPGKYETQTLEKTRQYFNLNARVTYCCNLKCNRDSRTCGGNGWSGSPPRCQPTNADFSPTVPYNSSSSVSNQEALYYFNQDFRFIADVIVNVSLNCTEVSSRGYKLAILSHNRNATFRIINSFPSQHGTVGCTLTFAPPSGLNTMDCTNCTVQIQSRNEPIEFVKTVSIKGWTDEVYNWMDSGCPPIDPYIGMPDEYTGKAAMHSTELNANLLRAPCRDGYWLNNSEELENSPRKCVDSRWTGAIPKCILLTCKTPSNIANGYWNYASSDLFHKVQYSCEPPLVLSNGDGIARCHHASNTWQGIPNCIVNTTTSSTVPSTTSTKTGLSHKNSSQERGSTDGNGGQANLIRILGIGSGVILLIIIILAILIFFKKNPAQDSDPNRSGDVIEEPTYAVVVKSRSKQKTEPLYANTVRKSLVRNEEHIYSDTSASGSRDSPAQASDEILYCELQFAKGNTSARASKKAETNEGVVYASIVH